MSEGFRRDLELAPGGGFRLRRRLSARIFSALLAFAAIAWGAFDLSIGYRFVGAATIALAVAFVVQLVWAELDSWRFEDAELRSRRLRLPARKIRGVQVEFVKGRARAWVELRDGGQVALVEGDEAEVRRIADRLSGMIASRPEVLH
ncbi:MAG: hypothetical protein ABR567_02685 [Myxococcales bacterium]|nr:hypothetical protein [Myxococcales bacterium]